MRLVIAEDNALLRDGLIRLLEANGCTVVAAVDNAPQLDAALRTLELAPLTSKSRQPWVVRLRYAYADTLEAAGRDSDALAWFHRAHAVDSDQITDAADRAERIEKRLD